MPHDDREFILSRMGHFADARSKIERAKKHIRDIQLRIGRLEDSYITTTEMHPNFGYTVIKYDLTDTIAAKDISLLIGDALHNLKCALDYAWLKTLERHAPSAIGDKTQFPSHPSIDSLKDALQRAGINLSCPDLYKLMLTQIKPYPGGNDELWAVKQLNILDKHRLLLPLIAYTGISELEMENESGEPEAGLTVPTFDSPPLYVRIPDGWHVKNKGKPSITMHFDENTPSPGLNAVSFLELYSINVLQTVGVLESF